METLNIFKEYSGNKQLTPFPKIVYSNLYKKVLETFHFEFEAPGEEKFLYSPFYSLLMGEPDAELNDFVTQNEEFLDTLKEYILSSLFVYSALIEENAYYLLNPQSVFIARVIHKKDVRFEVKFYTHFQDELQSAYNDKIYIGRDFLNLKKFDRKYLGLKKYFRSLVEQNEKIQERARHKLRYFDDYEKPYLKEIEYLTEETNNDAMERILIFPHVSIATIPKNKLQDVLDCIHYLSDLMLELHDFTQEFDARLRLREEHEFVRYLAKFMKDLEDGIRYLRKLSCLLHLKISNYSIFD